MNQHPSGSEQAANSLAQYLGQFQEAWKRGDGPDIEQFVAFCEGQWEGRDQSRRIKLLEELIMLDLGFRWQQLPEASDLTESVSEQRTVMDGADGSKRWLLDDYVAQYPELGPAATLPLPLVLKEYRVRQEHGDTPSHQEYVDRFPEHSRTLRTDLVQVDTELSAAIDSHTSTRAAFSTSANNRFVGSRFGDYELLDEIARGGMGVVYRASQISLNRTVAVKMIISGQLASEEEIGRFYIEAEAAAKLQHPHIVTIHEVGELKGQHYFSMDFVDGQSLAQLVSDSTLSIKQAVELVVKMSSAIDYAHGQGILHRDLKPQNILIDRGNQPRITDFGLAKTIEGQSDLTGTGQILGTPSYMPPEQACADASEVGPASDIYALGAILYELVTGRPPFKAQTPMDTLMQVLGQEPVSPRLLNASVPRDLETVILKCLQKQPSRRYASAGALCEELGRYLEGKPIQARPVRVWERGWRWCRRKPAVAGIWSLAAILLLTLSIGGPMVALQQSENARRQAHLLEEANSAQKAEVKERKKVESAVLHARRQTYISDMLLAESDWEDGNIEHLRELLDRYKHDDQLKGFEWEYWNRCSDSVLLMQKGHLGLVWSVNFSPDGKRIVSGSGDKTIKVWNAETGNEILTLTGHLDHVVSVSFSPDGRQIVSGSTDGTVKVWDVETGEELLSLAGGYYIRSVAFSPDGKRIINGSGDKTIKVWNAETGQQVRTLKGHSDRVESVAFSPDGKRIVSISAIFNFRRSAGINRGSVDSTVKVWDVETGELLLTLFDTGQKTVIHQDPKGVVPSVIFSPDGKRIISSSGGRTVKVWDVETAELLLALVGHASYIRSVACSPDGSRIVSSSGEFGQPGEIKLWDAGTGQQMLTLVTSGEVTSVSFSPDGRRIVSGGGTGDRTVKVWDVDFVQHPLTLNGHTNVVRSVTFSPDGKRIVSGSVDQTIKVWDAKTGRETHTLQGHNSSVNSVSFSPDGQRIVSGSSDHTVKTWDAETGQEMLTLKGHSQEVLSVAFSPDGRRIVSGSYDKTLKIWNAATGQQTLTLQAHRGPVKSVSFSPDGKRIVSGSGDNTVKVWDAETGRQMLTLKGHTSDVDNVSFSPDGKRIVSGSDDTTVKVWDADTGQEVLVFKGHLDPIKSANFSPDGKRIVSSAGELVVASEIKIWDADTGAEMLNLKGHKKMVTCVSFSPDGKQIVSGSSDKKIKLWPPRPKRKN